MYNRIGEYISVREDQMRDMINVLKSLSDETRLRIINLLYERELCVCEIMEALHITQTKASRHLSYLKNSGLVEDRKCAQWVYYSLKRGSDLGFLDSLVLDNLRNLEPYKKDMACIEDWTKKKVNLCEQQ